jgi:hypothetical protein
MDKKTKSLLEELQSYGRIHDLKHAIENRASNVINSAINLIDLLHDSYSSDIAELLEKKILSAVKSKDASRFTKAFRKINENKRS